MGSHLMADPSCPDGHPAARLQFKDRRARTRVLCANARPPQSLPVLNGMLASLTWVLCGVNSVAGCLRALQSTFQLGSCLLSRVAD